MMAEPIRIIEELLERARAGNLEAFGELLAQYRNYARLSAIRREGLIQFLGPPRAPRRRPPSRGGLT
jgi:hypothetical protein